MMECASGDTLCDKDSDAEGESCGTWFSFLYFITFYILCSFLVSLRNSLVGFSALMLLVGRQGIRPVKNGGWWKWVLVSPDGVAPSRMVGMSASENLPLHHKVQKFSSGTGSPGWSRN